MTPAVAARVRQLQEGRDYRASVAEFRRMRAVAQRARTARLLDALVQDLAELLSEPASVACIGCRRKLATRVRNCPHCRDEARAAS